MIGDFADVAVGERNGGVVSDVVEGEEDGGRDKKRLVGRIGERYVAET